jgi:hypothetical protein
MPKNLTRRAWAATVAVAPAALAQAPATPQSAAAAETPEQHLEVQRKQLRRNLDQLGEVKMSQFTEPAFRFEA